MRAPWCAGQPGDVSGRFPRTTNAKIRAGILEVKRLLKTDRAFQLWTPTLKEPFPLAAATVSEVLAIVLGSDSPRSEMSSFEMANFLAQAKRAGVIVAEVSKRPRRLLARGLPLGICRGDHGWVYPAHGGNRV